MYGLDLFIEKKAAGSCNAVVDKGRGAVLWGLASSSVKCRLSKVIR